MRETIQKARNPAAEPPRGNRAGGKARLITFYSEETECNAETE